MQSKRPHTAVIVVAILAIAALEALALQRGCDGTFLSLSVAAIAALGGVSVGEILAARKGGQA